MMSKTYGRRNGGGPSQTFSGSPFDGDASEDPYDPFSFSEEDHELEDEKILRDAYSNFNFSSQDFTYSTSQSDDNLISSSLGQRPGISLKETSSQLLDSVDLSGSGATSKLKAENGIKEGNRVSTSMFSRPPPQREGLATLVETEESGEIVEDVDEVNLSLDGLKRGRPIRVRRASLLRLLTICGDSEQRRRLRGHGLIKRMIDVITRLSFDDSPSNLAAAALFYFLTADDKDFHLLNSESSITFLIKLLKPLEIDVAVEKVPSIGSKLLALRKVAHSSLDTAKKIDSTSDAIFDKVKEILVDCKHMEPDDGYMDGTTRPELNPKWIALLTIEKACFSAVSLDGVETLRKTREKFKGRLRELGGLDAIFELAIKFRPTLEDWLENTSTLNRKLKVEENVQCLVLLLKCLRIMENCTFLSKDNQNHLLEMRKYLADQKSRLSFTDLVIRFINILSDLSLLRRTLSTNSSPEFPLMVDKKDDSSAMSSMRSSQECSSSGRIFPDMSLKGSQDDEWLSSLCSSLCPTSETISRPVEDRCVSNVRTNSSKASSSSKTRKSLPSEASIDDDNMKICFDKSVSKHTDFTDLEDSQDPFAFDEEEFRPSKWDVLHGRKNVNRKRKSKLGRRNFEQESSCHLNVRQDESEDCGSQALVNGRKIMDKKQKSKLACKDFDEGCSSQLSEQQDELQDSESRLSTHNSCSYMFNEESDKLLSDCLLTAVKVLMNLTNDNDLGCCQIASCGGLETLSSLIATHFPLFGSTLGSSSETKNCPSLSNSTIDLQSQTESPPFSDQDIDFLVVILGVLVNMVEKDEDNRSRLVSSSVLLPCSTPHKEERRSNIIPLLCSIFLVNQGAGETAGEGNDEPWDVEVALMQGEKEAEKMIIEAYAALLLAFLSTESFRTRKAIADRLPTHKLAVLIPVLERFVAFHVSLDMISPETHRIVKEVIESLRFS